MRSPAISIAAVLVKGRVLETTWTRSKAWRPAAAAG